jgi:hypothetical protein
MPTKKLSEMCKRVTFKKADGRELYYFVNPVEDDIIKNHAAGLFHKVPFCHNHVDRKIHFKAIEKDMVPLSEGDSIIINDHKGTRTYVQELVNLSTAEVKAPDKVD